MFAFGLVSYFILSNGGHPFLQEERRLGLRETFSSLNALQAAQKAISDQQAPCVEEVTCYTTFDGEADKMRGLFILPTNCE